MIDLFTWLGSNDKMLTMVLAFIGWIIAAAMAWNNIRWRVRNLEHGQNGLKEIVDRQVQITHEVELNNVELKQIAKATEQRLVMLESRNK